MRVTAAAILMFISGCLQAQNIRTFNTATDASQQMLLQQWLGTNNQSGFQLKKLSESRGALNSESWNLIYRSAALENIMLSRICSNGKCIAVGNTLPDYRFENIEQPEKGACFWFADSATKEWQLYTISAENNLEKRTRVATGQITYTDRRIRKGKDSFAPGYVFAPDPLSRANVLYGGNYKDRSDSNDAFLDAQKIRVMIPALFLNDSFRPGTSLVSFGQISNPATPATVVRDSFLYNRSQTGFEDIMAAYHLHRCYLWWDSLGFGSRADTVLVDAHAFNGADESAYNPVPSPPNIEWGTGGVDDAEDADALVHEYCHAAIQGVLPRSYQGTQRQGVEEGICDFMATAYSELWTKNQSSKVYNWDGHNEFWAGRELANNRIYPSSLTNQPHVDGQLFGAALYDLMQETGRDSAVSLVLGAMPLLLPNISMPQAAQMLLKTDSLLFNGKYNWPIVKAFYPGGLLPSVSTETVSVESAFWITNTLDFANGENAQIHSLSDGEIQIFDVAGRELLKIRISAGESASLCASNFQPGVYFIQLNGMVEKLVR